MLDLKIAQPAFPDVPELVEVYHQATIGHLQWKNDPCVIQAIKYSIASDLEQKIKLAEEGVIHFLAAEKDKKLSYILYDFDEDITIATVRHLYAVPGLKAGKGLLERTLEFMKKQGAEKVALSSLPNATGFYKMLGFEEGETTLTRENSKLKPLYKMVKSL